MTKNFCARLAPTNGHLFSKSTFSQSTRARFFDTPPCAGRTVTAGFTYLQRIGKAANYDMWFPADRRQDLFKKYSEGTLAAGDFPTQWAAIREIELLHESGNHKIYDLDPQMFERAVLDLSRSMRAGGYRLTIATLGAYDEGAERDDLEILDQRLQEGLSNAIHMLYLEETSEQINAENAANLTSAAWDYREALPHVGMVLGAQRVFGHKETERHRLAGRFFDILNALPHTHIAHDTAVGLQIPELSGENQWNYIASPEETLNAFNRVLSHVFDKFNGVSLGRLHGREDASDEIRASTLHLRGYGDRLNESQRFYQSAALALG
ncbi:MAG: hypothetical protein PHS57_09245 [Alphaproteobacteria bacterium]|nr:hypothetical protein [Alphaproteobacteria bacterium]